MTSSSKSQPLDALDRAIVRHLANDARMSNKELAAKIGLAPSSCLQRVRRLERDGVLKGYHASIDLPKVGLGLQAMVSLRLVRSSSAGFQEVRSYLVELPEVLAVYHMAGSDDFLVHVVAEDVEHLRGVVVQRIASRDEVGHLETNIIFEHVRSYISL